MRILVPFGQNGKIYSKGKCEGDVFYWLHKNLCDLYSLVGSHTYIYIILSLKRSACVDRSNKICCGWQQRLCVLYHVL